MIRFTLLMFMMFSMSSSDPAMEQEPLEPDEEKKEEVEPRIFVSIPNYRDPEGQATINDLFTQASRPERVFVGHVLQIVEAEDKTCTKPLNDKYQENVRTKVVEAHLARGPCAARRWAQELWKGEEFYLQIDSHTRFAAGWDSSLLQMWHSADSKKPIITTYPPGYELDSWDISKAEKKPALLCAKQFGSDGMLRIASKTLDACPQQPLPSLFWAAGFAFSSSEVIKDAPYPDDWPCLFFGEESAMAVRLWTSGYDFFCPTSNVLYHLWSRSYRPSWRELFGQNSKMGEMQAESMRTVQALLTGKEVKSGLGEARTLKAFCDFCGIDFDKKEISVRALSGGQDKMIFRENRKEAALSIALAAE